MKDIIHNSVGQNYFRGRYSVIVLSVGVALHLKNQEVINRAQLVSNHCKSNGEIAGGKKMIKKVLKFEQQHFCPSSPHSGLSWGSYS